MQKLGQYLLSNNLRVYLAVLACILIPYFPFNVMGATLIALITLQRGPLLGLSALAWALLPSIATNLKFGQMAELAMNYDTTMIACVLAWGFALCLRHFRTWSRVLEAAGVTAIVALLLVTVLPANLIAPLMTTIKGLSVDAVKQVMQADPAVLESFRQVPNIFLVGMMYVSLAILGLIAIVLARIWQLVLVAPEKKRTEFYHIRMNRLAATVATVVLILGVFTKIAFLRALVPTALILLAFAGLSLVRFMVATKAKSALATSAVLVATILLILFVPQFALAVLTVLCIADSWIDLRRFKIFSIKRVNG